MFKVLNKLFVIKDRVKWKTIRIAIDSHDRILIEEIIEDL